MAAAVQEALNLQSVLDEIRVGNDGPTVIKEDNQSCIVMCMNPVMQKQTKHIDVKHHFFQERENERKMRQLNCSVALTRSWKLTI